MVAVGTNSGNKKVADRLKKGQKLKKDEVVWVLDPKGTVYVIDTPKGKKILDEKQYQEYLKNVHKTMDRVLKTQQHKFKYAAMRHDAQAKINDDQWFVSAVVGAFSSVDEPKSQRKRAEGALKIPELTSTHTEFSGDEALYTAAFVLAMNKGSYDRLSDELKAVIDMITSGPNR